MVLTMTIAMVAAKVGAQPKPDDEIELEPDTVGSGSGSGSAKPADPAQPPPQVTKDPKAAKKWFYAGVQLAQKGDYLARKGKTEDAKTQYDNAVVAFGKSIEAGDDLNVYYDLAVVEEKLGKLTDAAKHYRVITKATSGIKPDVMKKATTRYDDITTKIGLVTLNVKPDGATIAMADTELGKSPLAEPIMLMPGTYTFSLTAEGFEKKDIELVVEAGSESERTLELEPVKVVVVQPKQDVEQPLPEPVAPPAPSKLPLYVGGGVTIAAVGVTAITGILAIGKHGTFTSDTASDTERADAQSSGRRFARISDVSLVTALVAGGFTTYWYLAKYRPALAREPATEQPTAARTRRRSIAAKVTAVPWVETDGVGGVTIAGWF